MENQFEMNEVDFKMNTENYSEINTETTSEASIDNAENGNEESMDFLQTTVYTDDVKGELKKTIEAVLFALGRAVSVQELAKACHVESRVARETADTLAEEYDKRDGGILIRKYNEKYELCSSPKYFENLVELVSTPRKPQLTDVMMETLSIIAYKNPSTKVEIEKIRGVKSDFAVNRLVEFGLVEEAGRLNAPGHPVLFKPTDEFYRRFGVSGPQDMPKVGPEMETRIADEVELEIRDIFSEENDGKGSDNG